MPQWYACAMVNRQTELASDDTARRDSDADMISRQSNVLPLDTARVLRTAHSRRPATQRCPANRVRAGRIAILRVGNIYPVGSVPSIVRHHGADRRSNGRQNRRAGLPSGCRAFSFLGTYGNRPGDHLQGTKNLANEMPTERSFFGMPL